MFQPIRGGVHGRRSIACRSGSDPIADIEFARHKWPMKFGNKAVIILASALALTACSAQPTPSSKNSRDNHPKTHEVVTTVSLTPHQWRKDRDCFESGAQINAESSGYFEVGKVKWRSPRAFRGYFYTNFEGASYVAGQRSERPDGLGEGRYQTDLYSTALNFPNSVEPQTYWIEFIGREALCNSQRPDDARFDLPFSPNLVRVEKILRQERVR